MNIPDELLAAYLEGELQGAERARIEQAILHDARLAQRAAQYRNSRARLLRDLFDHAVPEPVPRRMLHSVHSAARPGSAQVIDLARVRAARKRRTEHPRPLAAGRLLFVASLLGAALLGVLGEHLLGNTTPTEYRDGVLVASGPLAAALNDQLDRQSAPGNIQVGMSFKAKSGSYCRTFSISDQQALSGLACRDQNRWRLLTLLGSPAVAQASQSDQPSPLLLQTVREHISGTPLDAAAQAKARADHWR